MAGCTARRRYVIPVLYGGSGIAVRRWENDANDWDAAMFYGGIFTVFCVSLYCRISFAILEDGFGNTGCEALVMGENRGGHGCKARAYRVKERWAMGVRP